MNMIQNAKDQVLDLTVSAYQKAAAEGLLPQDAAVTPSVEIPKDTANGDYTTTFCLAAAKALKKNPRQVAQILMDHMDLSGSYFTSVEMAGPRLPEFPPGEQVVPGHRGLRGAGGGGLRLQRRPEGSEDHGGVRLRQPHRPHAHGQRPGRRPGRHPGLGAAAVAAPTCGGSSMSTTPATRSRSSPRVHRGPLSADHQGRGRRAPSPRTAITGDDIRELARAFYDRHGEKLSGLRPEDARQDALAQFGLAVNIPKMKTRTWPATASTMTSGSSSPPSTRAAMWPRPSRLLTDLGWTYEKDGALWLQHQPASWRRSS